jgi:segregation and condensation protein B
VTDDPTTPEQTPPSALAAEETTQQSVAAVDKLAGAEAADADGAGEDPAPESAQDAPQPPEVPVGDEVVVDDDTMRRALEAILMVTDEPLPVLTLARAIGRATGDVADALAALAEEYTEQGRGFDLREVGGGWRYYTRAEAAPYVERFVLDGQQARLTQAALETLSVVAYKQPVSRARVSAIRGVNVDGVMRTLVARGLVEEAGADTESQATLYRTTTYFLERMGMQSLDDLPELAPYLPDMDDIEEELAAQSLPPTPPPEDTTPTEHGEPAGQAQDAGSAGGAEHATSVGDAAAADTENAGSLDNPEDAEPEPTVSGEAADGLEDAGSAQFAGSAGDGGDGELEPTGFDAVAEDTGDAELESTEPGEPANYLEGVGAAESTESTGDGGDVEGAGDGGDVGSSAGSVRFGEGVRDGG